MIALCCSEQVCFLVSVKLHLLCSIWQRSCCCCLIYTLHWRACTHQPALQESRSCSGQWPGSTAAHRCSSRSRVCPRSGRSCSWPGPRTRSRLWSSGASAQREHLPGRLVSLTYDCRQHTLLLVAVGDERLVAVAKEGALGVDAVAVGAQRLVVAFVHIWGSRKKLDCKKINDNICNILKTNFEFWGFFVFFGGHFRTHQCTPAGCCRSRSPFRSSTRNRAACSRSDLSCRFPQRTENTRQCLQTRKEQCA